MAKPKQPKVTLTKDDLKEHLKEQLAFLKASADAFDKGSHGEAKRMAAVLRVLLHETAVSHSLLGQIGIRQQPFLDTAGPYDSDNALSTHNLVGIRANEDGARYFAYLDQGPFSTKTKFSNWWETVVLADNAGRKFTRRSLILTMSNQDGGAHVDPQLDQAYSDLKRNKMLKWSFVTSNSETPIIEAELHSVRQIAHEVLRTLEPSKPVSDQKSNQEA